MYECVTCGDYVACTSTLLNHVFKYGEIECYHSLTVKMFVGWIWAGYVEFSSTAAALCDVVDNGAGRNVS